MIGGEKIPEPGARTIKAREKARFTGEDVRRILGDCGWMGAAAEAAPEEMASWCDRAAMLLGPQAEEREELVGLLELVFHYEAAEILESSDAHVVLARAGARTVIRELGREVLGGRKIDSDRLKEIFERLKQRTGYRGRELFHPLRLALAGRAGEGKLDRVILLVDGAARLPFRIKVKGSRERILEFCGRMD